MKLKYIAIALMGSMVGLTSCEDELELVNPNQQTSASFGTTPAELEEAVIAAYNHMRMEGTFARMGFMMDVMRGDEAWNASQTWNWLGIDDHNTAVTNIETNLWTWREWYYTLNVANFIDYQIKGDNATLSEQMRRIKGQALFIRGIAYYHLAYYHQNVPLIIDYSSYSTLDGLYAKNNTQDEVMEQVEKDLKEAMELLPSKEEGGEWATGRATNGAAAAYYARALMARHKFAEALPVLKDIIGGKYGKYELTANYGDNFREGSEFENNIESIFEIQYLDNGMQGTEEEWTPVNTNPNATQAHAMEAIFAPGAWSDASASPWLYHLFKAERTKSGSLDPRLYWTIGTYEKEWEGFEFGNMAYTNPIDPTANYVTNANNGGLPICKNTNQRTGLYANVQLGLRCGINLRLVRYSDILLRAAECENEISGPTQQAIDWINIVRRRANLNDLKLETFAGNADKLFEQIANVERPKEFGCEFGRGFDLIRWGFYYSDDRIQQLKEHSSFCKNPTLDAKQPVTYQMTLDDPSNYKCSMETFRPGHEYFPMSQQLLNENPNLRGNSANDNIDNKPYFESQGWKVRPVVDLSK